MSGIRHRPASSYEDTLTLGAQRCPHGRPVAGPSPTPGRSAAEAARGTAVSAHGPLRSLRAARAAPARRIRAAGRGRRQRRGPAVVGLPLRPAGQGSRGAPRRLDDAAGLYRQGARSCWPTAASAALRPQEKPAGPMEIPDRSVLIVRRPAPRWARSRSKSPGSDGAAAAVGGAGAGQRRRCCRARSSRSRKSGTVSSLWRRHAAAELAVRGDARSVRPRSPSPRSPSARRAAPEAHLQGRGRLRRRLGRGPHPPRSRQGGQVRDRLGAGRRQEGRAAALRASAGAGAAVAARLSQAGRGPELPRDRRPSLGRDEGRADAGGQGPGRPDRDAANRSRSCCRSGASPSRWRAPSSSSGASWSRTRATACRLPAPSMR